MPIPHLRPPTAAEVSVAETFAADPLNTANLIDTAADAYMQHAALAVARRDFSFEAMAAVGRAVLAQYRCDVAPLVDAEVEQAKADVREARRHVRSQYLELTRERRHATL